MPGRQKAKPKKLTKREYAVALIRIAKITYQAAPLAVLVQVGNALISAIMPLVTIYFAAQTTTALAEAYAGDSAAGTRAMQYVIITAILGVLMTVMSSVTSYVSQLMRYKVEAIMSDRLYEHFLMLDFWRYDDKDTADMYDRSVRFANFFPYVFDRSASIMTQLITMLAGLVALTLVNWWLGLIVIVAVIPGVYIQFKLSREQAAHWNKNVETRRSQYMIEHMFQQPHFIAELRLYSMVRHLLDLRMKLRDKNEKGQIEFERKYIRKRLGADALHAVAEVTALLFTVIQIIAREQPIGQFLYVQQVVSRALDGANQFVSEISTIDQDLANLFDYQQFTELPVQQGGQHELTVVPSQIELRGVSFRYPSGYSDVLQNVSMTIKHGQHVAIVGENGAGKSTLIKLLLGLYAPTQGTVLLDDTDLQAVAIASWHRRIGVLHQGYLEYSFATARDNIYYGDVDHGADEKRLKQALERSESGEFLSKLPKGIDSYVSTWMEDKDGVNGVDLSGGQWQRLALARNFYRDSPIIILDEPTSAIDALAESRIFKRLFADKERTVVTISHRLTTIEKADVIYMLKDGKLVEQGTHDELVAKRGEYYTMFASQLRK